MGTIKELANRLRTQANDLPGSLERDELEFAACHLDMLAKIDEISVDISEIEKRHLERQCQIDNAARDAANGSRLAALCHGRSQEHDDRASLLFLLKKERQYSEIVSDNLISVFEEKPLSDGQYFHLLHCNGDRRQPAGTPNIGCICLPSYQRRYAEINDCKLPGTFEIPKCGRCLTCAFDLAQEMRDQAEIGRNSRKENVYLKEQKEALLIYIWLWHKIADGQGPASKMMDVWLKQNPELEKQIDKFSGSEWWQKNKNWIEETKES